MSHLSYCCLGLFTNIVISYLHVFAVKTAKPCISDLILSLQRNKINQDKMMFNGREEMYSEE